MSSVTRPPSSLTYDGNEVIAVGIVEDVARSGLVAAWLKRNPLRKVAENAARLVSPLL